MGERFKIQKKWLWAIGLLSAAVIALGSWFIINSAAPSVTLPDGTTLKLIATHHGAVPIEFPKANPIKRAWWQLKRRMPSKAGVFFNLPDTDDDCVTFYFRETPARVRNDWIPDTCRRVVSAGPVDGIIAFVVHYCPTDKLTLEFSFHPVEQVSSRINTRSNLATLTVENPIYKRSAN